MSNQLSIIDQREIENRIFTFRSVQIMIDSDLAELYGVETKVLNQAVKRNIERFPETFRFQLTVNEYNECSRSQIVTLNNTNNDIKIRRGQYGIGFPIDECISWIRDGRQDHWIAIKIDTGPG